MLFYKSQDFEIYLLWNHCLSFSSFVLLSCSLRFICLYIDNICLCFLFSIPPLCFNQYLSWIQAVIKQDLCFVLVCISFNASVIYICFRSQSLFFTCKQLYLFYLFSSSYLFHMSFLKFISMNKSYHYFANHFHHFIKSEYMGRGLDLSLGLACIPLIFVECLTLPVFVLSHFSYWVPVVYQVLSLLLSPLIL